MKKILIIISLILIAQTTNAQKISQKSNSKKVLLNDFKIAVKNKDSLALRILVKKLAKSKLNANEWKFVRNHIQNNPDAGFDLIYKWDLVTPQDYKASREEQIVNKWIETADQHMLKEEYNLAFNKYQQVAKYLKKLITNGKKENLSLYYTTLHFMGRALFSSGNFEDALVIYDWIPADYPKYRQILFEKMWTGFRLSRSDITNGSIASLHSSYFSTLIEPETYLVQLYIYKKLCRDQDVNLVMESLRKFKNQLERNLLTYQDWSKSEIETYILLKLSEQKNHQNIKYESVSINEKNLEQKKIQRLLENKFLKERERYLSQLKKVEGYSLLALGTGKINFKKEDIKPRNELLNDGKEAWPVDEGEDWVDEIGKHLYIGESQCSEK